MNTVQWILVIYFGLCVLIQFGRGCARQTRTYTMVDGISALIEGAAVIWLVTTL